MLSGKPLEKLIRRYLIDHSARRLNYLYWNDAKDATFTFVNKSGRDLTAVNNSELVFRVVRVRSVEDWRQLAEFIQEYLVDPNDSKATHVIRLDYLGTYLKSLNYDPSKIQIKRNVFGTMTAVGRDEKPLGTIDTDIHSLSLIDKLYRDHRKLVYGDVTECECQDIGQAYLDNPDFKIELDGLKVKVPVTENLDIPGRKYFKEALLQDPNSKLELFTLTNGLTTVVTKFTGAGVIIASTRVYLQYFLSKYKKRSKS